MQQRHAKSISLWLLIFMIILFAMLVMRIIQPAPTGETYTYARLLQDIANQRVTEVTIIPDNEVANVGVANIVLITNARHTVNIPNRDMFMEIVLEAWDTYGVPHIHAQAPPRPSWFVQMLPILLISGVFMIIIFFVMSQAQGGGGGRAMNFGKSRAKMNLQERRKVTFDEVAGLDEEKEEMAEIVDFLKNPKKYQEIGARIPRGILLVGPPGTGKTYLARAVAGEADVPFYSISGSDFVEMFVGVGASRVRDLFHQAKAAAPSIIIIDEIDAVGRRRGTGLGGGHDEREQTLNQLLVEMDGFGTNEGVIIMAATNRKDILDNALLRPGRFDRQVYVGLPDVKGREAILKVHARGKPLGDDIDLGSLARGTPGFTGADLENLLNEAALLAARARLRFITMAQLEEAVLKVMMGPEKKSRVMTEKARKLTAYHEAGHAVVARYLKNVDPVHQITIVPRGGAGGMTVFRPQEDKTYRAKSEMFERIVVCMGGRVAEKVYMDDISTGASGDIQQATATARAMVMQYGMSEKIGPISYDSSGSSVFIGRDFAQTKAYSEKVAAEIDTEVKRIFDEAMELCEKIIREHDDIMIKTAEYLLENEVMDGNIFDYLCEHGKLPEGELKKACMFAKAEGAAEAPVEASSLPEESHELPDDFPGYETKEDLDEMLERLKGALDEAENKVEDDKQEPEA